MNDGTNRKITIQRTKLTVVALAIASLAGACGSEANSQGPTNPTLAPIAPFTILDHTTGSLKPGTLPVATWDGSDSVNPTTTTTSKPPKPPEPPPKPQILPSDVLFDTDSASLKPGAGTLLKTLADQIANEAPTARLRFIGFTDSRGTPAHNLDLSTRRAQAVMVWFAGYGFDTGRMAASGEGEANLLEDDVDLQGNFNKSAGQKNRRVEIQIWT